MLALLVLRPPSSNLTLDLSFQQSIPLSTMPLGSKNQSQNESETWRQETKTDYPGPLGSHEESHSPLIVSKCYFGWKTSSGSSTQRPSETYFMRFVGLSPHHSPRPCLRTMPVNRSPRLRHCHKISVQQMLTGQKINFSASKTKMSQKRTNLDWNY